jgi:hypothetical protein
MTTIQISSTYLSSTLKPRQAAERIKEILYDFLDHTDIDSGFNTDLFIDELTTTEEEEFRVIEDEVVESPDIEIDDEKLDHMISDYLEYEETTGAADDDYGDDEDGDSDEAEDEPEFDFDDNYDDEE